MNTTALLHKTPGPTPKRELKKILGLSFGNAIMVGGIISTGILRNPGSVAAILPYKGFIISVWIFGGIYVLMALGSLAELATLLPKAGGTFNYVKLAFGNYAGFVTGWFAYIINAIAPAYFVIAISEYFALLFPVLKVAETFIAIAVLAAFTLLHLAGVTSGSIAQQVTSFIKIFALLVLVVWCFIFGGNTGTVADSGLSNTVIKGGLILAFV